MVQPIRRQHRRTWATGARRARGAHGAHGARGARRVARTLVVAAGVALLAALPSPRAFSEDGRGPSPAGAEADLEREGGIAPADAWPMEGGCSAHTGVSRARPLRGRLEQAWAFDVKGVVEEEPRVYR